MRLNGRHVLVGGEDAGGCGHGYASIRNAACGIAGGA
jgi:hypothetical protein